MGFFIMKNKNILKVIFVIIGTMIGAGFASRARGISVLLFLWNRRNDRINFILSYHGICRI